MMRLEDSLELETLRGKLLNPAPLLDLKPIADMVLSGRYTTRPHSEQLRMHPVTALAIAGSRNAVANLYGVPVELDKSIAGGMVEFHANGRKLDQVDLTP